MSCSMKYSSKDLLTSRNSAWINYLESNFSVTFFHGDKRGELPMIYPLTERRIAGYDRRNVATVESKTFEDDEFKLKHDNVNERRRGLERRQLKLNREKLLESLTSKKSGFNWQEIIKSSVIPVFITLGSLYVTYYINEQQAASAKVVADSQLESAEKIAAANREHSSKIASAELETQRLTQMAGVFSNIITLSNQSPKSDKKTIDTLTQQIKSLSVYGDEALPFLVQLRDGEHYAKSASAISTTAKDTIKEILLLNQPIVKMDFFGKKDKPLYLPRREYINYNLSGSRFKNVTLYAADFSHSLLKETEFIDANLRKANFSNASLINARFANTGSAETKFDIAETNFDYANLKGATFINVDLSKVNFQKSFIKGVKFVDCDHIANAKFSMHQFLQANAEPFKSLGEIEYSKLLMKHETSLTKLHKNNAEHLKQAYIKMNLDNPGDIAELQETFSQLRETIAQKNPIHRQPLLTRLFLD